MLPHRLTILAFLSPGLIATAYAADPADTIVVSATRTPQPLDRLGQSVTLIDQATIQTRQSQTIVDLLRATPGLSVARNGGLGATSSIFIRGGESDQTTTLIDGVKLNDPAAPGGGFNFGNLLVGNVARVEVLRGPQSVLWGSQAIGGVVNIITTEPSRALSGNARLEYGYRGTAQLVGNVAGAQGRVSGSLGGGWFTTRGISALNEQRGGRERDGYENFGGNAKVKVALSQSLTLDLRAWLSRGTVGFDGFPPPAFTFADTNDYSRTRETVGYAGLLHSAFDGRLRNRFAATWTDTRRRNYDPESDPVATFLSSGRNLRYEYQGVFDASDDYQLTWGAETERSRFTTASPSSFDPEPASARAEARISSGYGQLVARPFAGLTLIGGARYDQHSTAGHNVSVQASGSYTLNDGATRLKASYGEGFKAPSLFQLYSDFGNRSLKPEEATGWDAGFEQRFWDGRGSVGAAYFSRLSRNLIDFISCFGNAEPICVDRPFGTYDNVARSKSSGVEAALQLKPFEGLAVSAQYTHLNARNRAAGSANFGRLLARRPQDSASLIADYRHASGVAVGGTVTAVGDSFDNASNRRRLTGYVLVDLRASYRLTEDLELYARGENLLRERYETAFQFGSLGRAGYVGVRTTW